MFVPKDMSRITKYKDDIFVGGTNTFSAEIDAYTVYSNNIDIDYKYFFRYFVPVNKRVSFEDYDSYGFLCKGIQTGSLIKIVRPADEVHLYHFEYRKEFYLIIESTKRCDFKEIENIAFSTLLTLGFFLRKHFT